jgi:hypothetical protein
MRGDPACLLLCLSASISLSDVPHEIPMRNGNPIQKPRAAKPKPPPDLI